MLDLKNILLDAAPGLASLLGGPFAGSVVGMLAKAITGRDGATEEDLTASLQASGLTPEVRGQIAAVDAQVKMEMIKADVQKTQIAAGVTQAFVNDTADARRTFSQDPHVYSLGVYVLIGWAVLLGGTLVGLFMIATGGTKITDPGMAASVFTVLGAVVGYVANIAQQVTGYFFGSSLGSATKTDAMAQAIAGAVK